MISSPTPSLGEPAEDLHTYIMVLYTSVVESSANLDMFLLSSSMTHSGMTFNNVFRRFYSDFYRLHLVTKCLSSISKKDNNNEIQEWFQASENILTKNRKNDRRPHAKRGLQLCRMWIETLYDKQIIKNVRN